MILPKILAAWVLLGAVMPAAQAAESSIGAKLAEIKSFRRRVRAGLRGKDDDYRTLERRYMRLRKEHSDNAARLDAIRKKAKPKKLSSNQAFTALVERQQVLGGRIETAEQMEKEYLRTVNSKLRMLESQLETLRNRPQKADKNSDAELEAILNQTRRKASAEKFKAEDDNRIEDMRRAALKAGGLNKKEKKPGLFKRFLKRMAKD